MEHLNRKFDSILQNKQEEIMEAFNNKKNNIKMTDDIVVDDIGFSAKTTLSKINAEQERKYKASKTYKNKNQYVNE